MTKNNFSAVPETFFPGVFKEVPGQARDGAAMHLTVGTDGHWHYFKRVQSYPRQISPPMTQPDTVRTLPFNSIFEE